MFPIGTLITCSCPVSLLFGRHASPPQVLIIQTLRVFDLVWHVVPLQCLSLALELSGFVLLSCVCVCVCVFGPQLRPYFNFASALANLRDATLGYVREALRRGA